MKSKSALALLVGLAFARMLSAAGPDNADLRRMLAARVDLQKAATGTVLGVLDPNGVHLVTYGTMGLDDKRPVAGDSVFQIGSITKIFTALLLADMAQRGEVAMDDPVSKHLPQGMRMPERNGKQVTLGQLALHTSGLPLRPTNLASKDPANKYAGYSLDLLREFVSSFALPRDPGSEYEYSNVGYGLLGIALAQRAGVSYAELVRTRITVPLGLSDTRVESTSEMQKRTATGYDRDLRPVPRWEFDVLEGAGALQSTANDLLKLLEAILDYRDSPLSPAMKTMLVTRHAGGMPPAKEIALAWNISPKEEGEFAWKNGSVGGFRSFIGYDPKTRIGVVALANAQTAVGVDDIGMHVLDAKTPVDLSPPVIHKQITLQPAILDRYVGKYRFSETDTITITREGAHLFMQQQGSTDKLELFAEGERKFFLKEAEAQVTFETSGDKRAHLAIWHQGGKDERGERIE